MPRDAEQIEAVTALLPVGPGFDPVGVRGALACLRGQTLAPAEILVVANGLSEGEEGVLRELAGAGADEGRVPVRFEGLGRASLAGALNLGLREAGAPLVARMDADDWCPPGRLERQAAAMSGRSDLAGMGCWWEVVGAEGQARATMRPPADPARLRWTLLLGNCLAHGSMVLRREAVLAVGGYDESLERAQDLDLWLRLTRARAAIGVVPEVLYRYVERTRRGVASSSRAQAEAATGALARAWAQLPSANGDRASAIRRVMADAMTADAGGGAPERLGMLLDADVSREGLLAWLWSREAFPPLPRRAMEVCRRARLREVGSAMRGAGVGRVWLWGAGAHTAWLLDRREDLGVAIAGVVDEACSGQTRHGLGVLSPESLEPGEHVLLSSDFHEDAMWERSGDVRARGVTVWRLYADEAARASDPRGQRAEDVGSGAPVLGVDATRHRPK